MPIVRTRFLSDDDVIVQRKVWFLPRSWNIAWYDFASLRSSLHSVEGKILAACNSLETLLQQWSSEKEHLEAEVKAIKDGRYNRFGVGEPFYIKEKALRKWIGGQSHVPRPEESWKSMINPAKLIQYGLRGKPAKGTTLPNAVLKNKSGGSGNTRYTLEGQQDLNLHVKGIDQVITYKEEKGDSPNRNVMKRLRRDNPKQSGESDQAWNNRLQKLAKQENNR